MRRNLLLSVTVLIAFAAFGQCAYAEGHYLGGVANIRDFAQPFEKGLAVVGYNPYYQSDDYRDDNGDTVESLSAGRTVRIGRDLVIELTATISNIDLDVKSYSFNPLIFYFTGIDILGANYGIGIGPSYNHVRTEFSADLAGDININGRHFAGGTHLDLEDSASGFGDLMVRPVMLDWSKERYDVVAAYSFYAPTGSYDSEDLANTGLGYWSHEFSLGGLLYFNKKATALLCNAVYEVNTEKEGSDLTPGQNIIFEYGISQYFATWFEVGLSQASYFQTTDTGGSTVSNKSDRDVSHTVSAELTLWPIAQKLGIVGRYFNQYYAKNTLRGQGANVTMVILF